MKWLKHFGTDLVGAHLDGARTLYALRWMFGAIILWEFAQHVVEYRIGMFENVETARAVSMDSSRMMLGWIKMLSVYVGGFFVLRYLGTVRANRAVSAPGIAFLRYLPYLIYSLILFGALFYARQYLAEDKVVPVQATIGLGQVFIEPMLMAWIVSSATDGAVPNPIASARRTGLLYLYALPLFFVGRLPINILHQMLNRYAVGREPILLWPMLVVDAVVVGLIVAIIPAISVRVAMRIDERTARREEIRAANARLATPLPSA